MRVAAQTKFIDAAKLTELFQNFNNLGEALAYVTKYSEIKESLQSLEKAKKNQQRQG